MPYVQRGSGMFEKSRILISGFPNSGKTQGLLTFIYGPYAYNDERERSDALAYAHERDRHMVIIECPGETGYRTLPEDTDYLQSYYIETAPGEDTSTLEWSRQQLAGFRDLYTKIERIRPDILAIDGISALSEHILNDVSDGQYLAGTDLGIEPSTGRLNDYRRARVYGHHHTALYNWLAMFHASPVKVIIATCWEDWEAARTEDQRPGAISDTRYLWPMLPGKAAKGIVGKFDARISARMEKTCMHTQCELSNPPDKGEPVLHHVWQVMNKNDVMGLGIKGLPPNPLLVKKPWIHQKASALDALLGRRQ